MKKSTKSFWILLCLGVLSISGWTFIKKYPIEALSIFSYIKDYPPIVWNNVMINYNFGIHYYDHKDSISFHYWGKEGQEGISVVKDITLSKEDIINTAISQKEFKLLSISPGVIDGHQTIEVEKIKNINGEFYKSIYILDRNIAVGYGGPRDRYMQYEHIISSLHIINVK
jgi:hypothetical protein